MRWNNKIFALLNVINGKILLFASKGILRHYHYWSDPKLGPGIVGIRIIPCSFHDCTCVLFFYCDPKIKESVNKPRYGIIYNRKYCQTIGCHNN